MAMSGSFTAPGEGWWVVPQLYRRDSDDARKPLRRARDMAFFFAVLHGYFSV
jgi:hypothetical protein